jgi:hypothetical protein
MNGDFSKLNAVGRRIFPEQASSANTVHDSKEPPDPKLNEADASSVGEGSKLQSQGDAQAKKVHSFDPRDKNQAAAFAAASVFLPDVLAGIVAGYQERSTAVFAAPWRSCMGPAASFKGRREIPGKVARWNEDGYPAKVPAVLKFIRDDGSFDRVKIREMGIAANGYLYIFAESAQEAIASGALSEVNPDDAICFLYDLKDEVPLIEFSTQEDYVAFQYVDWGYRFQAAASDSESDD